MERGLTVLLIVGLTIMKHKYIPCNGSDDLWVVLPGFLTGLGFSKRCLMHEHVNTLYIAPPARFWRKKHTNKIRKLISCYSSDFERVVLAGHSMAAEFIFLYSDVRLVDGLVCYSGLCNDDFRTKLRPPTLYVAGMDERIATRSHTIRMYEQDVILGYTTNLLLVDGFHPWASEANSQILSAMNALMETTDD